jgi:hypothetical protein
VPSQEIQGLGVGKQAFSFYRFRNQPIPPISAISQSAMTSASVPGLQV